MGIAKGLGKPVRVDNMTLNFERARFARVCVEVDLRRPLKGSVLINEERYCVAYEGLSTICSQCGIYGHLAHACTKNAGPKPVEVKSSREVVQINEPSQEADGFTLVWRSGRTPGNLNRSIAFLAGGSGANTGRNLKEIPEKVGFGNIAVSNSFENLGEDIVISEGDKVGPTDGMNKENEFNGFGKSQGNHYTRGNSRVSGGDMEKGRMSGKGNSQDKRAGHLKPNELHGTRNRAKQSQPTKGLIFWPNSRWNRVVFVGEKVESGEGWSRPRRWRVYVWK